MARILILQESCQPVKHARIVPGFYMQGSCQKIVGADFACNSGFSNLAFSNLAFSNLAFSNLAFPKGYACATARILHNQKSCQTARWIDGQMFSRPEGQTDRWPDV